MQFREPAIGLIGQAGFSEIAIATVLPDESIIFHDVIDIACRCERTIAAEVVKTGFVTVKNREIDRIFVAGKPGQLTEIELLFKLALKRAVQIRRRPWNARNINRSPRIQLIHTFESGIEVQDVLDDRTANIRTILITVIGRMRIAAFKERNAQHALVLVLTKYGAVEIRTTGLGDGRDNRR